MSPATACPKSDTRSSNADGCPNSWNIGNPSEMGDYTKYHPWRAPGFAPTSDPCGMGGAYLSAAEGGMAPEGSSLFARGSELPVTVRTE